MDAWPGVVICQARIVVQMPEDVRLLDAIRKPIEEGNLKLTVKAAGMELPFVGGVNIKNSAGHEHAVGFSERLLGRFDVLQKTLHQNNALRSICNGHGFGGAWERPLRVPQELPRG